MTPDEIARLPYRPCVGVVLVNAAGEVFAGQRVDRDTDAWQMPQGGVDPGEALTEAALRELWEETGVTGEMVRIEAQTPQPLRYDLPHALVPNIWKGRFRGQEQDWFLMRFLGEDSAIDLDAGGHREFSEWRWLAPQDLISQIVPFKREVYQAVFDIFGDRL